MTCTAVPGLNVANLLFLVQMTIQTVPTAVANTFHISEIKYTQHEKEEIKYKMRSIIAGKVTFKPTIQKNPTVNIINFKKFDARINHSTVKPT